MNTPRYGDHFLTPDEHRAMVPVWQKQCQIFEQKCRNKTVDGYQYGVYRKENDHITTEGLQLSGVANLHGRSFFQEIEKRLGKITNGYKVKILDVGGGAGLYADDINGKFPGRVKVFTTGLRERNALRYRKNIGIAEPIRGTYLKWRSITELSNFPEFDIIVDTLGEFYYTTGDRNSNNGTTRHEDEAMKTAAKRYLYCAIAKLEDKGLFSAAPISYWAQSQSASLIEMLENLRRYFPGWQIDFRISYEGNNQLCLEIRKTAITPFHQS